MPSNSFGAYSPRRGDNTRLYVRQTRCFVRHRFRTSSKSMSSQYVIFLHQPTQYFTQQLSCARSSRKAYPLIYTEETGTRLIEIALRCATMADASNAKRYYDRSRATTFRDIAVGSVSFASANDRRFNAPISFIQGSLRRSMSKPLL